MNVREVLEFAKKNKVQVVDLKFVDLIGTWQHFTDSAQGVDGRPVQGRFRTRRFVDPRLEGDQQQRHAGRARSLDCLHGSVLFGADAEPDRQRRRSDHPRNL
jgi:glutamine synthetase